MSTSVSQERPPRLWAKPRTARPLMLAVALAVLGAGCHQGMWDNSRIKPLEKATNAAFFPNGGMALALPEGTVQYGAPAQDDFLHTGKIDGEYATAFPFEITPGVLKRGQNRFTIFCQPCHSPIGDGNGMIVQREMKQAGNYHLPRLREAEPGYFFDVMTNGFGVMYSYASRITPEDRWAIAAYIRVLQYSQNAPVADLPADVVEHINNPEPAASQSSEEAHHEQ
ncbi:MAG: cytochrome c [Candidatus Hydrogenedentes bacterium]|nr:cytochrome c [Candidatus Hydrogenedentota bacterium]